MKTITKEKEYELIEKLIDLEKQLQINESEKIYCNTASEKTKNKQIVKDLKALIMKITSELIDIENPIASREIQDNLEKSLCQMKKKISNMNVEYQISKRQGRGFNDYFATRIFEILNNVLNIDSLGIILPLYITSEKEDGFDRTKLIVFFEQEINGLRQISLLNYIALRNYFVGFTKRLIQLSRYDEE